MVYIFEMMALVRCAYLSRSLKVIENDTDISGTYNILLILIRTMSIAFQDIISCLCILNMTSNNLERCFRRNMRVQTFAQT